MSVGSEWLRGCSVAALLACTASCFQLDPLSRGSVHGRVMVSTPVEGAVVQVWQLSSDGADEQFIAAVTTGRDGRFELDLGTFEGPVRLVALDGNTAEPWSDDRLDVTVPLRAVMDIEVGLDHTVAISPLTTLATAWGEQRRKLDESAYTDAMRDAYRIVSEHFGVDIARVEPEDIREPIALTERAVSGLMLAGLSSVAHRIAAESSLPVQRFNTLTLMQALIIDGTSHEALFDGRGPELGEPIVVGACPVLPECTQDDTGCPTPCMLSANTLRSELASALVFEYLLGSANKTGIGVSAILPELDHIATNDDPELFGGAPVAPIAGKLPEIVIEATLVDDESRDIITFSPHAEPLHAPGGSIVLGIEDDCPTVYKHVSRLDRRSDNPLRWRFAVSAPAVGVVAGAGAYRVRVPGGDWLAWRPLTPLETTPERVTYELLLLRSLLPELATMEGIFEIEFRGMDRLGQVSTQRRCWNHIPLAAPLWVSEAREVVGPESLHAAGLEPGKTLAPLINGVPLEQGKGLMEFEVRNGTEQDVYLTLSYVQPQATYVKDWIITAKLLWEDTTAVQCIDYGTCPLDYPYTTVNPPATVGNIPDLIGGLLVWDVTDAPALLRPCTGCEPTEYRIGPRLAPDLPRRLRVMVVATQLDEIAPSGPGELVTLPYVDTAIDPLYEPTVISGHRYIAEDVALCLFQMADICYQRYYYARYRALTHAAIHVAEMRVMGSLSPTPKLPARAPTAQPNTFGSSLERESFEWMTTDSLPPPENP